MENLSIIVCGEKFNCGARVVLWNEPFGFSFYNSGKYLPRKATLEQLRKEINCFVYHHSVTWNAQQTYRGLIGRGLSVNFIIDDDDVDGIATIYQCLDVCDIGYSHKPLNNKGPGVEVSYMPQAWENNNLYSKDNIKKYNVKPHSIVQDKVHGAIRKVFAPTQAQVNACVALAYGLSKAFPNMKMEFPKDQQKQYIKTVTNNLEGLLNHFNITNQKIDTAGLPLEYIEKEIYNKIYPIAKTDDTIVIKPNENITKEKISLISKILDMFFKKS